MCLSVAIERPDDVLSRGEHAGFQWMVIHNGFGYRCGYVRIPRGHPWHGKTYDDLNDLDEVSIHGGLTFSRADQPCDQGGADDAWWIGFDCAHAGDGADMSLPGCHHVLPPALRSLFHVWTTVEVEAECRVLCEQAKGAR
jgi:hypothetical protein